MTYWSTSKILFWTNWLIPVDTRYSFDAEHRLITPRGIKLGSLTWESTTLTTKPPIWMNLPRVTARVNANNVVQSRVTSFIIKFISKSKARLTSSVQIIFTNTRRSFAANDILKLARILPFLFLVTFQQSSYFVLLFVYSFFPPAADLFRRLAATGSEKKCFVHRWENYPLLQRVMSCHE